ncbi:Small subunit processome component [Clydaea vesicula]|uniref:U three protein 23 n=1 Tax=Clydaea vesicula TaxID=447962 RepID=A0AAD5U1H5_9FUNG|nr:Small subunit processome component [Clydaea vesicula]KAJ3393507.1 Small subunit processome component [Lobulomyces angularis]
MRVKRQKQQKKIMAVYTNSFQFREPFQVLVDGTFLNAANLMNSNLEESIPRIFAAQVKLMTTNCVHVELKTLGYHYKVPASIAASMEKRKCNHYPPKSPAECFQGILGEENKFRYCVATQDKNLRSILRKIPGTPLIYINKSVMILEPTSPATTKRAEELELEKSKPLSHEKILVLKKAELQQKESESNLAFNNKKKKPAAPNPLSCKKKKPKIVPKLVAKLEAAPLIKESDTVSKVKSQDLEKTLTSLKRKKDVNLSEIDESINDVMSTSIKKKRKRRKSNKKLQSTD